MSTAEDGPSLGIVFDLAVEAMVLIDDSLRIVQANPSARRMLAAENPIGTVVSAFSAPALLDRARAEGDRWLAGELKHLERATEFRTGAGDIRTAVTTVDALVSASGGRYFLAQMRDVTTERRQHAALQAARDQYRQLIDNLPGAVVMRLDPDLTITLAAGEGLTVLGYRPEDVEGRRVQDAFPASVWRVLGPRLTDMLTGAGADFEYDSPTGGRQLRLRLRPLVDDGAVVGGLLVTEDVSEDRARRAQMQQVQQVGGFGGAWYDLRSGWTHDSALLRLWGATGPADLGGLPFGRIAADQVAEVTAAWRTATRTAGHHSIAYRIGAEHGIDERYLQSTHHTVVDGGGRLLRMVSTHVDVTETVRTRERNEQQRLEAAEARRVMLRRIVDSVATSPLPNADLLTSIVTLVSSTLDGGAALRVFGPDRTHFEVDLVAPVDTDEGARTSAHLHRTVRRPVPTTGVFAEVIGNGNVVSALRTATWSAEFDDELREWFGGHVEHIAIAPVRHGGTVLGVLAAMRHVAGNPYRIGDDDVLQVLADKAGTVLHEMRQSEQHLGLLERMAGMESRERHLLAESIHDEPIQQLVAAVMRLEMLGGRLDPGPRAELMAIAEELEGTTGWLQNLIMVAFSPPELSAGLGPALSSLADGTFAKTDVSFRYDGPRHVPLTVPAKEAAYRVLREAMLHVRQRAGATAVVLRVDSTRTDGHVALSLADDAPVAGSDVEALRVHAVMKARAEPEGGTVTVTEGEEHGTTVTLVLPAVTTGSARPADPAAPTATPSTGRGGDGATTRCLSVVVCDDRPEMRRAVDLLISRQPGFEIVGEGQDGDEGLRQVQKRRPDVLVVDFSMPGGGPALVRAVKRESPATHVIVFTGRGDARTREAMQEAGADQYVVKTGRLGPLLVALQAVAQSHDGEDQGPGR
ncbi:response regulator [Micromonospora sp.]|uniref:response regulator n=1 Tax=Micromonospora sp. TaxID=1876 RepID=UPI003B3ABD45